FLNQGCVLGSNFELLMRARRPKIVLQQYLPIADLNEIGLLISALARCTRRLRATDDRQAGGAPFRQTIFERASSKPALSQRCNRFIGEHAIRAAAVRNNFF